MLEASKEESSLRVGFLIEIGLYVAVGRLDNCNLVSSNIAD